MQPLAPHVIACRLFAGFYACLFGLVVVAVLTPAVVTAREAARHALCTNIVRQHSGSHPDVVVLEHGKIVKVASCWCCGSHPWRRLDFMEELDGELRASQHAMRDGFAVLREALDRLRQYNLDRSEGEKYWFRALSEALERDARGGGCGQSLYSLSNSPKSFSGVPSRGPIDRSESDRAGVSPLEIDSETLDKLSETPK
jgi:hypothetical protein